MNENIKLFNGDCLEVMDRLIGQGVKVDAIITDPPYNTTACHWDKLIPFDEMWIRLNKLIKPNGAIVLFGSEPFSSALRMSNIKNYKYDWVWKKEAGSNFATVKYQPMKEHEIVSIFTRDGSKTIYNPQMQERVGNRKGKETKTVDSGRKNSVYGTQKGCGELKVGKLRNPSSVQEFKRERGLHPTQKPVALMEYLIKTYTDEGDVVLDFTMGSGTTGVACVNTNRKFIGIELDENYFKIAEDRIHKTNDEKEIK